jgi:hypothetical protein
VQGSRRGTAAPEVRVIGAFLRRDESSLVFLKILQSAAEIPLGIRKTPVNFDNPTNATLT